MKSERLSKELVEVRSRLFVRNWQAVIFDVGYRLLELRKAVESSDSREMYRHTPVAVIAALETYFRGTIVDLVNRGEPYRSRVSDLVRDKVVIKDAISFFHGENFTFGEVIANFANCNSVSDIHTWLETLLNIDPHDKRNGYIDAPLIINDVNLLYRNVEEVFRLRHIFAHEAAAQHNVDKEHALQMINAIQDFTDGMYAVLWDTAFSNLPLTTRELNQYTYQNYQEENEKLMAVIAQATRIAERDGISNWFVTNQKSWESFCQGWIEQGYRNQNGSVWNSEANSEHATLIQQRTEMLIKWISSRDPEIPEPV
jgi:hypothetical protein